MRLVYFGDSFTFGQGYPDCQHTCWEDIGDHSHENWAAQTAELLNVTYVNKAYPGLSNQEMFYMMRAFDFEPDDFIVVQWSYDDRDMLLNRTGIERVSPWMGNKISERYLKVHSDVDMAYRSDLVIEHCALWLKQPYLMLSNNKFNRAIDGLIRDHMMRHCIDRWADNHPGPETNKAWAALVAEWIKERGP